MFFARVDSAMLAKGLSAPQHSTYLVILLDGLVLVCGMLNPKLPSQMLFVLSDTLDRRGLMLPF